MTGKPSHFGQFQNVSSVITTLSNFCNIF